MSRPRALVVYESIFGNTRLIAEGIGRGLAARYDVEVAEVSSAPAQPRGYALVVVGGPIHALGMSREASRRDAVGMAEAKHVQPVSQGIGVREWLGALEAVDGSVDAAAFDTAGKIGWFTVGSAARGELGQLERRGYHPVAAPEHFYVRDMEGPLREGEVERATAWAASLGSSS